MKTFLMIITLIIPFIFSFCHQDFKHNQFDLQLIDSLNKISHQNDSLNKNHIKQNAQINLQTIKTKSGNFILYKPQYLSIAISNKRPDCNKDIFLCLPGAFTSPQNQIEGLFIVGGVEFSTIRKDPAHNGICIFVYDSLSIEEIDSITQDKLLKIKQLKGSLFQQSLLVRNSKIVSCSLFSNRMNIRRALVQLDDNFCICQSTRPETIKDFQLSLIDIGVKNAIYLDMGTYSKGWYKNSNNEKIIIGEPPYSSTKNQSNWLIFQQK